MAWRALSRPPRLTTPSLAADSRRARNWLLRTAMIKRESDLAWEPFPISPFTFVPDDEGDITGNARKGLKISRGVVGVIHVRMQVVVGNGAAR